MALKPILKPTNSQRNYRGVLERHFCEKAGCSCVCCTWEGCRSLVHAQAPLVTAGAVLSCLEQSGCRHQPWAPTAQTNQQTNQQTGWCPPHPGISLMNCHPWRIIYHSWAIFCLVENTVWAMECVREHFSAGGSVEDEKCLPWRNQHTDTQDRKLGCTRKGPLPQECIVRLKQQNPKASCLHKPVVRDALGGWRNSSMRTWVCILHLQIQDVTSAQENYSNLNLKIEK